MLAWKQDYSFWCNLLMQWQEQDALPLPANAQHIQLSIFCAESLKDDADPKQWYAQLCLFKSEEKTWQSLHAGPDFDVSVVDKAPDIRWTIRRLTLLEVSQDATLTNHLKQRLQHIADYTYEDLPTNTEWYWYQEGGNLINLAWVDGCYLPPQPSNAIAARDLPFRFQRARFGRHHVRIRLRVAMPIYLSACRVLRPQTIYCRSQYTGTNGYWLFPGLQFARSGWLAGEST